MENIDLLKGRLYDLIDKASTYSAPVNSKFHGQTECSLIEGMMVEEKLISGPNKIGELSFFFYGGKEDNEAKCLFIFPNWFEIEKVKEDIDEGQVISCLHIYPKNVKFADQLTHRDVLGSLMNLGYERDEFGDIFIKENDIYVYLLEEISEEVKNNLSKIKHTNVVVEKILPKECPLKREFEIKKINVPSFRIDAIIGETFNISRTLSEQFLDEKCVFLSGKTITSKSYLLKEGDRVSIKGLGKFVFLKIGEKTRKDRYFCEVKIFK